MLAGGVFRAFVGSASMARKTVEKCKAAKLSAELAERVKYVELIFFGVTSWANSDESLIRRQRLRRAIATARLASA